MMGIQLDLINFHLCKYTKRHKANSFVSNLYIYSFSYAVFNICTYNVKYKNLSLSL